MGSEKTLQQLQSFIKTALPNLLEDDLHRLLLVKEADVESASYYHIRKFLGNSEIWRVMTRKHAYVTGYFSDMLIFRKAIPKIAIEYKWNKLEIGPKDKHSLEQSLDVLGVNKAYWITVIPRAIKNEPLMIKPDRKRVMHYIAVSVNPNKVDSKTWQEQRKKYGSQMLKGKGRSKK